MKLQFKPFKVILWTVGSPSSLGHIPRIEYILSERNRCYLTLKKYKGIIKQL